MKRMKQVLAFIGVVCGLATIVIGFNLLNADYGAWQSMTVSFGADFYTYSYEATARAANNVLEMAKILRSGFAYLLMALGALGSLYFGIVAIKTPESTTSASALPPETPVEKPIKEETPTDGMEEI